MILLIVLKLIMLFWIEIFSLLEKVENEYIVEYYRDDRIIARKYELLWYNLSLQYEFKL